MLQNDGITIFGNDTSLGGTITATILDGTNGLVEVLSLYQVKSSGSRLRV